MLMVCLLGACGEKPLVHEESFVFGTRVEIVTEGSPESQARAAINEVLREFDRLHRTYHAWQPSPLTDLNKALEAGQTVTVSPEMANLVRSAQTYAEQGDELFDPAIGKLIALWGFQSDTFKAHLPDPADIHALVEENPRMSDITVNGNQVSTRNRAVKLDFGGIAKGWALDKAAAILRRHGIKNALINIGGNIMALGSKGNQPWTVGIQNPRKSGAIATLAMYDGEAIGTSGDYQRYFELDGKRYCHLIDPRTGRPSDETEAVTILITPRKNAGMLSDAASKPIFLSPRRWREMAHRFGINDVLRIDSKGRIMVTTDMRARLHWTEGEQPDEVVQ